MALTAPIRDRLALLSFFPAWLKEAETRKAQSSGRALKHNKKKHSSDSKRASERKAERDLPAELSGGIGDKEIKSK